MDIFENLENLNVSEECFNDIMDIVEEVINERNKANREAKKNWELKDGGGYHTNYCYSNCQNDNKMFQRDKKYTVEKTQDLIRGIKKKGKDLSNYDVIDQLAHGNRIILGRAQNPVSFHGTGEIYKNVNKEERKEQSQRGSTKDTATRVGAREVYKEPGRILQRQEEKRASKES